MKGEVLPDHIRTNKYLLVVVGLPPILFVSIDGIEEVLATVTLPDRTVRSGGVTDPIEFNADTLMHHKIEQLALEAWYAAAQDPIVDPTYVKTGVLTYMSGSMLTNSAFQIPNMFPRRRRTPDVAKEEEGKEARVTWSFAADGIDLLF